MTEKEQKVEAYKEQNKSIISGQTLFVGSSLMEQFPTDIFLKETDCEKIVYNRGIGGFVIAELLEAIHPCILDLKPSRIFINIGTNDLSNPNLSIEEVMEQYDHLLNIIEKELPGVEIYLMAYYPINAEAATEEGMIACLKIRTNEKIANANKQVAQLAAKHHQRFIDVNAPMKDEFGRLKAEYTLEGMHINVDGYRSIFAGLLPYVLE